MYVKKKTEDSVEETGKLWSGWWIAVKNGLFGEIWWKDNLRMTRETFVVLCDSLRVHIEKRLLVLESDCLERFGGRII